MVCKYCGKEMQVDDKERDRKGIVFAVWYLCDCGAFCYREKVNGFWKSFWEKEEEEN